MKLTAFIIFVFTSSLAQTQPKVFTEAAFISTLKKYHPVVKQAANDVKIAQAKVLAVRGQFDPVLKADNSRKEFDGLSYYDQNTTELKVPVWYGIDLYAGNEDLTGSKLNPEKTKGSVSYVGFSFPVVQNFIIDKRRATLQQAKIYRDLSEAERKIAVNNLVLEGLKAYWNWWEQYKTTTLINAALDNAEKRFKMIKTAFLTGDRPAIDTLEALTQIQSIAIRQSEVNAALIKATLELSTFLWKEDNEQYDLPPSVMPQDVTNDNPVMLDQLLQQAAQHPELVQYNYKLKALDIDKKLKLQSLVPKVDLKYNQLDYNLGKAVSSSWFQNNYRFGISLSMPLRLSEGRGEYQQAKLKIDQTRLEQVNKQVQVYNKVKQYFTDWQQTGIQLTLQNNLVNNILILQKGEETRFSIGESSLFLINTREMKTIETKQKLIELQAKNQKAAIHMKWAAGLLY